MKNCRKRISGGGILVLVKILQLFGDILSLGILEHKRAQDFFLGVLSVEHRDNQFDGFENWLH